jgi:hypothetical protein
MLFDRDGADRPLATSDRDCSVGARAPNAYSLSDARPFFLYSGTNPGPFHLENQLLVTDDEPRACYAPETTDRVLPKGLMIRDGARLETYWPSGVTLSVERGIEAPLDLLPT